MKNAIVTFYKYVPDEQKNFGFAKLSNGDIVYFNGKCRAEPMFDGGNTPVLCGWANQRTPQKGDRIMVGDLKKGVKGYYTAVWAFQDEYEAVLKQIEDRPTYQLWQQSGPKRYGKLMPVGYEEPRMMWEGCDLREFRQRFPKHRYTIKDGNDFRSWLTVWSGSAWIPA